MIIKELHLFGTSEAGEFSGKIPFSSGLNIISAENGFGKSLIVSGIGWCLGLEPMVSLSGANDNSIFSEAVRSKIEIGGTKNYNVKTSFATLEVEVRPGTIAKFTRPIIGADNKFITVEIKSDGKTSSSKLMVGYGTVADETAGFQFNLFKLLDWPIKKVVKYNGGQSPLYFENLGPLFFIEQLGGWTDIQAQQIKRYGNIDVAAHAFEYMMKLDSHYETRLQTHLGETHERELKKDLVFVIQEVNEILEEHGQHEQLSIHGKIQDLFERYSEFKIAEELKKRINWSYQNEVSIIQTRLVGLRLQLASIDESNQAPEGFKRSSEEIAHLRNEYKDLESKLVQLDIQKIDEQNILESLRQKIDSAHDLERFKTHGIGILRDSYHCPTCSQSVNLQGTNLNDLSAASLKVYIAATAKEFNTIQNSINRTEADIRKMTSDKSRIMERISQIESKFALLNNVVSQRKAEIIAVVDNIKAAERELEKVVDFNGRIEGLQAKLMAATDNIKNMLNKSLALVDKSAETNRLGKFLTAYRESIKKLDLSVFKEDPQNIDKIALTEDHLPMLEGRLLRNFASASDQARIILPYLVSLASIAIGEGRHPGFLILDEPLQQNPDASRRPSMIKYFEYIASLNMQTIIFTSLEAAEVIQLKSAKINAVSWPKGRFLK